MTDAAWNRLCLHAVTRSMVAGNVFMAPMFAAKQALFFGHPEDVGFYLRVANFQLTVFALVGWIGRLLVIGFPDADRQLAFLGLALWTFGLFLFSVLAETITFPVYATLSIGLVSAGGGLYFWCSLDDILLASHVAPRRQAVIILFGTLSMAYAYLSHWIYVDFSRMGDGYLFVHPILFMAATPVVISVYFEESRRLPEGAPATESIQAACNGLLATHSLSFALHLAFVFCFGLFRNVPALSLFLHHSPDERVLFVRNLGIFIGEVSFAVVFRFLYLPTISALILPIVLLTWHGALLGNVFAYGYCVGTFGAWIFHRTALQWLAGPASKRRIAVLLLAVSTMLLPGEILLNLFISLTDSRWIAPAVAMSLTLSLTLALHWVAYFRYGL